MAVISTDETWVQNPLQETNTGATLTRKFKVFTDTLGPDGAMEAQTGPGIIIGDQYQSTVLPLTTTLFICNDINTQLQIDTDRFNWIVTVTYTQDGSGFGGGGGGGGGQNTFGVSWDFENYQVVLWQEADTVQNPRPIVNSAQDPFESDVMQEMPVLSCTITDVIPALSFNPKIARTQLFTINKAALTVVGFTFKAEQVQLVQYSGQYVTQQGDPFYQRTRKLLFAPVYPTADRVWSTIILDAGFNEQVFDDATGSFVKKRIKLKDNQEDTTTPQLLDGAGGALDTSTGSFVPEYREFFTYPTSDFTTLEIPDSLPST